MATDNTIIRRNGTLPGAVQESLATVDDNGSINIPSGETYDINGSAHAHAYSEISGADAGTDVTASELEELTDGSETTLHSHAGGGGVTELYYGEKTSVTGVTATVEASADTHIAGASVAYDGSEVCIEFYSPSGQPQATANCILYIVLFEDGSPIGVLSEVRTGNNSSMSAPIFARRFMTPSAASHTYSIRAYTTSGTSYLYGGAGGAGNRMPSYLRITQGG